MAQEEHCNQGVHERVAVVATFGTGQHHCTPRKFRRKNGKEVTITEVGLYHSVKRGAQIVHIFDVTDGESDYRLELDGQRLVWHMTGEMSADDY